MSNSRSPFRKLERLVRINPVNLREEEGFNCFMSVKAAKKKIKIDTEDEPQSE